MSKPGCEGCGAPGTCEFMADGQVRIVEIGSDIAEYGTWTQSGSTVTIQVNERKERVITFTVEDSGKKVLDSRYSVYYFLR